MLSSEPCGALVARKCLELRYDGYNRIVEVHAVGLTKEGHWIMRVWQVRGGSVSNEPVGWKLLRLDEAFSAYITNEPPRSPAKAIDVITGPCSAA